MVRITGFAWTSLCLVRGFPASHPKMSRCTAEDPGPPMAPASKEIGIGRLLIEITLAVSAAGLRYPNEVFHRNRRTETVA